jgi:hypothetical protein
VGSGFYKPSNNLNKGECMVRMFTTNVGRFKSGDVRDFPQTTWKQVEVSAGLKLDSFSKQLDEIAEEYVVNKNPKESPKVQRRSIRT